MSTDTDRELLEAAARAAGMTLGAWSDRRLAFMYRAAAPGPGYWNPITDDGDALRLAVALKIDISWDAFQDADLMTSHDDQWWTAPYGEDRAASLRLAIVRAAAAIAQEPR